MAVGNLLDYYKYRGRRNASAKLVDSLNSLLRLTTIRTEHDDSVPSLTASKLKNILDSAANGECGLQAKLIGDMIEKDSILTAHFETRREAVLACDMALLKAGTKMYEKSQHDEYADVWSMLQDAGFYELLSHLLDAFPQGYSAAVIDWGKGGGIINGFRPVHPTNIRFDLEGNPALQVPDEKEATPLTKWHVNQFITHYRMSKPDIPCKNGMGRNLAWLFFFKHFARKSWVRFLEKFGIPFLIARLSAADFENTTLKNQLIAQLRTFASDGAVLTTEEGGVEAVTVAGHNNKIHEEFIRRIDECYALAILGQVGSSLGEPGRLGNNEQQQDVRQDRREADCMRLMATINTQLIRPFWQYKTGSLANCPIFVMDFTPSKDKAKLAEAVWRLGQSRYRVSTEQLSYEFGLEITEEPPEVTTPVKPVGKATDNGK